MLNLDEDQLARVTRLEKKSEGLAKAIADYISDNDELKDDKETALVVAHAAGTVCANHVYYVGGFVPDGTGATILATMFKVSYMEAVGVLDIIEAAEK